MKETTEAADFAIQRLPELLRKAERLRPVISDSIAIASLSRTMDLCLSSVYWERRNIESVGYASKELSQEERVEAQSLRDSALAILGRPICTPDEMAFALTIASAGQYAHYRDSHDFEADKRLNQAIRKALHSHNVSPWALHPFVRVCSNMVISAAKRDSDAEAREEVNTVFELLQNAPFDFGAANRETRALYITAFAPVFHRIETTCHEFFPVKVLLDFFQKSPLLKPGLEDDNQHDRLDLAMAAIRACRKVVPDQCESLWRIAERWVGKCHWDAKGDMNLQSSIDVAVYSAIDTALTERFTETCVRKVFQGLKQVLSANGESDQKMAELLQNAINQWLPRGSAVGLKGTKILVEILLESLQTEDMRDHEKIAEALVRLWTQLVFDRAVSDAFRFVIVAWAARNSRDLWIREAVFRATAIIVTSPAVSQEDVRIMLSWLKEEFDQSDQTIDEARVHAIVALCGRADLGITVQDFIETPERNSMNRQAARNLDESLTDLLAGRIAKSAESHDFEAALQDLSQVRRLAMRTLSSGAMNAYLAIMKALPEGDQRRSGVIKEYQELASRSAVFRQREEIRRSAADPSLRPYRELYLSKVAERIKAEMLPEPLWPFEPLYKADWVNISPGGQAIDIVYRAHDALAGEAFFEAIFVHRILAMRFAQPTFYKKVVIVEILLGGLDGQVEFSLSSALLMLAPDGATYIDGSSPRIHLFNQNGRLSIDTVRQAEDYLRFFCGAVHGDEGPFTVTESAEELLRRQTPESQPLDAASIPVIWPMTIQSIASGSKSETKAIWECGAIINYSNALFAAKFQIQAGGMVEMVEDAPLLDNLPVRQPRFRAGFRGFY